MLTRMYIDNFRSFVNFEYKPQRKQLLLGPNGSGKSSLLDAIRFLKQFLKGDENPFTQSTRTRWQNKPLQVLEVEALIDRQKYEYRVEMRFAKAGQVSVNLESLKVSAKPVFEFVEGKIRFFPTDGTKSQAIPLATTRSALHLSQLSNLHVRRFVEWMESVHCFNIDAYPGQMDESADREEQQPESELDNLAGWYRHLVQAYPEENLKFLKSIKEALDGFQTLRVVRDEETGIRTLRLDFAAPRREQVNYMISELSEGQRCLFALYMILHFLIARGHTVFIDEPDNFISLREIQPWLLMAEKTVEDNNGQLILISHHPEILNQWASKHGLRFFREENGHVRTEKFKSVSNGDLQPSELIARGWEGE